MSQTIKTPHIASSSTTSEATAGSTRTLLTCGIVAGPLFIVVALMQVLTRDGFDITRHALSLLSNGDLGWIQITNFVVTGLLFFACAVGMGRVLRAGRGRAWGPVLIGAFGLGLIGGGVFVADPAFGFPAGAPSGLPAELSWHGIVHGIVAGLAFLSLIAACFVFARRSASLGDRRWAAFSVATGVFFLAATVGINVAPGEDVPNVALAVAVALGMIWASAVARRAGR